MAAVTAAPIWHRQWQRGRQMWAEVIFHSTYYYLHSSTYGCGNNCQAYGKTQMCFAEHICVFQNTFSFLQNTFVFSIYGACLSNTLSEGHYLKNEIGFSNIFKKIWKRAKTFFLVRIPVSSCVILVPLRL